MAGLEHVRRAELETFGRTERHPALLWVHSGRLRLVLPRATRELSAGQAIRVPAGQRYRLQLEPNSVVVPLAERDGAPGDGAVFDIDPADGDWLIWRFARSLGFLAPPAGESAPLDLVAGVDFAAGDRGASVPLMPRSAGALEIARATLRHPERDITLPELAAAHAVSVRRVQQLFSQETGLPFGRWRSQARVAAAAKLLEQGRDVAWTAQQVGFDSAAGFSRAFARQVGMSPSAYARRHARVSFDEGRAGADERASASPSHDKSPRAALRIPATSSWERVNSFHVLVWMFRGTATVTVGGSRVSLAQGDGLWLPPGARNRVELTEGSILLPLGSIPGHSGTVAPPPLPLRFPSGPEAESTLLHHAVANYSWVRSRGHDPFRITRLFLSAAQSETDEVRVPVPVGPVHEIAAQTRADPAARVTLAEWATALSVDHTRLHEDFVRTFGQSFPSWRVRLRMTLARQYLEEGMAVREVASRVGYAHATAFTRAFIRAHGISPKAYRLAAVTNANELTVR